MAEFVFQMIKARKSYGDRVILDDVTLSFLPGAKIGVVGPNGMGKSTLLKIMAGLETVSNGEASLTPGFTVGILQQEPPLDDTKTVGENIKMAFGPIAEKVARFNEIGEEMANPDADFDADGRDGQAADRDRRRRRLGPRLPARAGNGRPAVPGPGHPGQRVLRWRAPPCGPVQAAA